MSPRDVREASLWEMAATMEGWIKAQGGKAERDMADDEFERAAKMAGWE